MSRKESPLFPWRVKLQKHLRIPQPASVTEPWLEKHRWWWRRVPDAIARHVASLPPKARKVVLPEYEMLRWRQTERAAFCHELERRCEPQSKVDSWPLLSRHDLLALLSRWPDPDARASLDTPALLRQFPLQTEWPFDPVAVIPHKGELLSDRNEPAWTPPVILAANLRTSDSAILARVKNWLDNERKRTGINSPKGGAAQKLAIPWRYCEILDRKKAKLEMDEVQHSEASKAMTLWRNLKNPARLFTPEFYFRVAFQDIPKHGWIDQSNLPEFAYPKVTVS